MDMQRTPAYYAGTEIDARWWKRYAQNGFLARGNGEYWMDASGFYFRRYLTSTHLVIWFRNVVEVNTGRWHSGRWAHGASVVKIHWRNQGSRLVSGFVFARDASATAAVVERLCALAGVSEEQPVATVFHRNALCPGWWLPNGLRRET